MIENIKLKGIITLTLRDAETMEIISERTEENLITALGMQKLLEGKAIQTTMSVSTTDYADVRSIGVWWNTINITPQSSLVQGTIHVSGTPSYYQRIARFNQPGSTRFLRMVAFSDAATNGGQVFTKVRLDPPCEQTNTQILDVTYRIQYEDATTPTSASIYAQSIAAGLMGWGTAHPVGLCFPSGANANWHKPPTTQYRRIVGDSDNVIVSDNIGGGFPESRADERLRKYDFPIALAQADRVGRIFGSILYGFHEPTALSNTIKESYCLCLPAVEPGFIGSPIQPIHNHSATTNAPFLDVNNLATGEGSVSMNGDSWTDPDYPKFFRFDMHGTGDVGTASYSFRQRNTVGFNGNGYSSVGSPYGFRHDRPNALGFQTIIDGHGLSFNDDELQVPYDGRTTISRDATGITIIDVIDGTNVSFDANSTPAFNFTAIHHMVVDDNKDIWIAGNNEGLFKISDPFGTPTITKMSNAVNGIPVGGDTICRGVSIGNANTVWALFDGGLSSSTDGGISWTNYDSTTPHPFAWTGITDALWTRVEGIVVDRESPDQQLAVMYQDTTGADTLNHIVWWSEVDTTIDGPSYFRAKFIFSTNYPGSIFRDMVCSRTGGFWQWAHLGQVNATTDTNSTTYRITYGSTVEDEYNTNQQITRRRGFPLFMYDYYGSPYVTGAVGQDNHGFFSADRKYYASMHGMTTSSQINPHFVMEDDTGLGKGIHIYRPSTNLNTPPSVRNVNPHTNTGTLNSQYSPFEDVVWNKYQWNGVAWELGYHVDALDTSGNSNDATRHNFDVEDYTFTGRAMIDVLPTFTPSAFANTGTFVFALTPAAKLSATRLITSPQEQAATIFELHDGSNRLILKWDDGTGNIVVADDAVSITVTAKPADGITYRVVVTLNAIDAKVYIDGTLTATLTLTAALDFSNATSNMFAHVGARTHAHAYNNRYNVGNFYSGVMENVQLWNVEWDQTDVTNDMGDITGVIVSKPGANLISRYELTQSLVGLETKPTHATDDALMDGLTVTFANGTASPAFVDTDYYTAGVVEGFLKDNATTITPRLRLYMAGDVNLAFSTISSATDNTNIVPGTTGVTTERVVFHRYSINNAVYSQPGELTHNQSTNASFGGQSMQSTTGDCTLSFKPNMGATTAAVGFSNAVATNVDFHNYTSANQILHFLVFKTNGNVDVGYNTSVQASNVATYVMGDEFRIERVGTTVTYYKVTAGIPTAIHTSATSSSGIITGRVNVRLATHGVHDVTMTYERPARMVVFGDSVAETGLYDPGFIGCDSPVAVFANGTPVDIVFNNTSLDFMGEPGPGIAYYNSYMGLFKFNAAEIGAAITGNVVLITDLPK